MFYSWSTSIYTHTAQRVWGLNSCTALRTHLSVRLINEKKATIYQMELSNGGARIPTKLGRGQDVSYISLSLFDVQNQKKDNFLLAKRGFRPCLFNMLLMVLTKTALEYELINFFFFAIHQRRELFGANTFVAHTQQLHYLNIPEKARRIDLIANDISARINKQWRLTVRISAAACCFTPPTHC